MLKPQFWEKMSIMWYDDDVFVENILYLFLSVLKCRFFLNVSKNNFNGHFGGEKNWKSKNDGSILA